MSHIFRAIWPITDRGLSDRELAAQAIEDVPGIALQARATITGRGQFRIAPSADVPGSGGVTEWCLAYEAPARAAQPRGYWKRPRKEVA